ncbi:MAG: hypothetical protein K8S20_10050 [Chloroflexi bacterium]|nr:hypothetical protein [Chloroflexota bacterium]
MKTKCAIPFLLSAIYLSACGGVTPIPMTTKTSTPSVAVSTNIPSPGNTPTLFPDRWVTSTPETIFGYPTPLIPVELDSFAPNIPVGQSDISTHDLYIGKYVVRKWCKEDEIIKEFCSITISSLGEKQVEIWGGPIYLGAETGTDLTGRGYPNIVVISGIGNAAGEVVVWVFEAGSTLKEILRTGSRREIKFVDLNNDKSLEFTGEARIWSQFSDCQILNFPFVYEYNAASGYVNKTSKYNQGILAAIIQRGLDSLISYEAENPNAEVPLCNVYDLVSAYLVSGQTEKAWDILDKNYSAETAAEYKAGFQKDFSAYIP